MQMILMLQLKLLKEQRFLWVLKLREINKMGKIRTRIIGNEEIEKKEKKDQKERSKEKKQTKIKEEIVEVKEEVKKVVEKKPKKGTIARKRGKNYLLAKSQVKQKLSGELQKKEIKLPNSIGKEVRVRVIDDKTIEQIEKGKIDFDILIAHPSYMPKIVKFAKILGPKGLMPNPKAGTISEKPEETAKKFESLFFLFLFVLL